MIVASLLVLLIPQGLDIIFTGSEGHCVTDENKVLEKLRRDCKQISIGGRDLGYFFHSLSS